MVAYTCMYIQWNHSHPDTLGTGGSVLIVKCPDFRGTQFNNMAFGTTKQGVLISGCPD